jgi:hypothetical protein
MATTTNFGWETPDDTDLVKDGAAAMRTLGNSIDTSFVDLKGGTTGQVLSKASATDLDFTWVTDAAGDITGVTAGTGISGGGTSGTVTVTNSMATAIDAKGDLIGGTGADTFARLAVGTNGQVLTADSAEATGLKWASSAVVAGLTPITPTSIAVGSGSASSAGNGQVTFTSVGTNLSLNGVFSSTYDNYLIVFQTTFSTATQLSIRYRASGTDTTADYYMNLVDYYSNGTTVDYNFANGASLISLADNSVVEMGFQASVRNPFVAKKTLFTAQYNNWQTSTVRAQNGLNFGTQSGTTSFDGITFLPTAGTITGTVSVYGLAK